MGRSQEIQQISAHPHAGNFPALEHSTTAYPSPSQSGYLCHHVKPFLSETQNSYAPKMSPLLLRQPIHGSPKKIQIYPTQQNYPVQAFQNSGHNLSVSASPVQSHRTTSHYSQSHTVVSALSLPLWTSVYLLRASSSNINRVKVIKDVLNAISVRFISA